MIAPATTPGSEPVSCRGTIVQDKISYFCVIKSPQEENLRLIAKCA